MGIECGGYEQQRIFVNTTAEGQKPQPDGDANGLKSSPPKKAKFSQCGHFTPENILLPDSLCRSANESQCLGLFWDAYLPNGRTFSSESCLYSVGGWITVTTSLHSRNEVLKAALMAHGICMGGIKQENPQMLGDGRRLYCETLGHMARTLHKWSNTDVVSLIATSRLLTLFEVSHTFRSMSRVCILSKGQIFFGSEGKVAGAQANAWAGHYAGERAVMFLGKPTRYQSGDAHQVFTDGRLHLVRLSPVTSC
jgi:hypothetical protein